MSMAGNTVRGVEALGAFVVKRDVCLAIITTPPAPAQEIVDTVVKAGIKSIWNFAPFTVANDTR